MVTNMKVIVAGSRHMVPTEKHVKILDSHKHLITEVVSCCARGADKFGESWAEWNNIPIKRFPAEWDKYGKGAGHTRNKQMAEYANGLIAFIYNNSKGTTNMIKQAKEKKLWIEVIKCKSD